MIEVSNHQNVTENPPNEPRVRLTPAAVAWVKQRRELMGLPSAALRVGVKGGGCAGYSYVTDLVADGPRERELVYEFDGVQMYVDERSLRFIDGSTIDAKNSLMYQGLKFDNPHEEKSCGCGATFSVKS
ncbi:MAG TPA: iron-sulfur cluster assembly accessory protein [Polyangiaceae bacterium]